MVAERRYSRQEWIDRMRAIVGRPAFVGIDEKSGACMIIAGKPEDVVIEVTYRTINVYLYNMIWDGPHKPVVKPKKLVTFYYHHLPTPDLDEVLLPLVRTAQHLRQATFRKCRFCRKTFGPEHMHNDVCHGCAENHLGIVH